MYLTYPLGRNDTSKVQEGRRCDYGVNWDDVKARQGSNARFNG